MTHDDAMDKVHEFVRQRHVENRNLEWLFDAIEDLEVFTDAEIWELVEAFG